MKNSPPEHVPVLSKEILLLLAPQAGETIIDATIGCGGHAKAFLEAIGPKGKLIGIDADRENLTVAERNLAPWQGRFHLIHGNFRDISNILASVSPAPSIMFADLGLSSPHIDDPSRGFTFRADAPLDLRFNREESTPASSLIARCSLQELVAIFRTYGELPRSLALAEEIHSSYPTRTSDLRSCVEKVFGWRAQRYLPQVFQALRIAVNDELSALRNFLRDGPELLAPGGRMGIVCYHSLEDRMVKQEFRRRSLARFRLLTAKAVRPTPEECAQNPRSRSARFRAIQRTVFPAPSA